MQIVRFVYFLTIFDLSIWLLSIVYPAFDNYLSGLVVKLQLDPYYLKPKSMIIYTYETATALGIKRFSGFWHEPGAFAILIGYCICFNTLKKNTLISKENLIFLIALLVTFSTTAYIAIAFSLYFTLLLFLKRNTLVKIILLPIVILLSFFIYSKTEFLGEKIENQVEYQTDVSIEGTKTSGRILGLRKSINILKTYPLSGRGLSSKTEADTFSAEHHGYGWPGYFARIGIPLSILLSILFYKGLMIQARYYNADTRWVPVFLCLLVILLFSQKHTSSILFMMIFLTPIAYANRLKLILNQRTKNQSSLNNTKYLFKSND